MEMAMTAVASCGLDSPFKIFSIFGTSFIRGKHACWTV